MKIELKRIQFSERMSEETNCFVADLYINGKKVGEAKNEGHGGPTDYFGDSPESNKLIREAEAYCKTLPKVKYGKSEWDQDLEWVINEFLENYLKEKEEKSKLKKMENSIMYGVPGANSYYRYAWKGKKLSEIPLDVLQRTVDNIRREKCKNGVVIFNTNLTKLGVK